MHLALVGVLGSLGLAASALGQDSRPFPIRSAAVDDAAGEVRLAPDRDEIRGLLALQRVRLTGLPLPGGDVVDLELERIDPGRHRFGFRVDGESRSDLSAGLDLSLWKGGVVGEPGSEAMLSLSGVQSGGWIQRGGQLVHLLPLPGDEGSWRDGDLLAVTEVALNRRGDALDYHCEAQAPRRGPSAQAPPDSGGYAPGGGGVKECTIAIETDYQLFEVFGELDAMTVYIMTLLSFVSNRYELQASTILTFPYVQFYTDPDDPWSTQESGGNCVDLLYEFRDAWAGQVPEDATLGHFVSGAKLGCGVAWVDVLCKYPGYNFSVSGNINGLVNFPVQQQPYNWDFMVIAHELGHNFKTWHTHDYCPPLDECAPAGYWGSCQDETICLTDGTIMSYCHLCPGGTGNITTYFHPVVADVITSGAMECLPDYEFMESKPGPLFIPDLPAAVSVMLLGGDPVGPLRVHYRYDPGSFASEPLSGGQGIHRGFLPPPGCHDDPEFYFAFDDSVFGEVTYPLDAPQSLLTTVVGIPIPESTEDFEIDTGWTAENLGASAGDWDRGVPVDDPSWTYAPDADHDGSGNCWLTANVAGESDVDGGAVRLTSPAYDMIAHGAVFLSYSYFLYLEHPGSGDALIVEANGQDGNGLWHEISRYEQSSDGWRSGTISYVALLAAGVQPTIKTHIRFTVQDVGQDGVVEAAIDAFEVSFIYCDPIGTNYCGPANLNSTGTSGVILAIGSEVAEDNQLVLVANLLPPEQFGFFLASMSAGFIPFAGETQGNLCLGGDIGRYDGEVASTLGIGHLTLTPDLAHIPTSTGTAVARPGDTWHFQAWFRDDNPYPTSNFTDGVRITFE